MEPTRVAFPDCAHAPRNLAITLAHLERGGEHDFLLERMDVLVLVHALHRFVVYVERRGADTLELRPDGLLTFDRVVVPDEQ